MSETKVDETIDFEEIKQSAINKWTEIRLDMNDIIQRMGNYCSFCHYYHVEEDMEAPEECKCPAKRACIFALYNVRPEAKALRKQIANLISRIKRVKP